MRIDPEPFTEKCSRSRLNRGTLRIEPTSFSNLGEVRCGASRSCNPCSSNIPFFFV